MTNDKPTDNLFVEDRLTPLTESEAAQYLNEAFFQVLGYYPSIDTLAILWSHSALESGRWKFLHHFNWGNAKKIAGQKYTSFKCSEILNGKEVFFEPYHLQTLFAAWDTPLEGAIAYIKFLANRTRYKKAWAQLLAGNTINYSIALHDAGYYTANVTTYTKGVLSLTGEFKKKASILLKTKEILPEVVMPVIIPEVVVSQPVIPELKTIPSSDLATVTTKTEFSIMAIIFQIIMWFRKLLK